MTTTITTFGQALAKHGVPLPDDLLADVEIPVITDVPQRQGDVAIWPRPPLGSAEMASTKPVPAEGIVVVRGESASGNAHILDPATGTVFWSPIVAAPGRTELGVLHVPAGSVALLTHTEEHTSNGIGAGTWLLTGKREQADEIRRVAD